MTEADESTLEALIQFRLGDKALSSTFTGSSTQKNEAFNRSLTKFNPKSVTCSKTFTGRAHAAVLNVNKGFRGATDDLLGSAGHQVSLSVNKQIDRHNKKLEYSKSYQKSPKCKQSRIRNRSQLYRLHEQKYKDREETDFGYKKDSDVHQMGDAPAQQGNSVNPIAGPSRPRRVL